MKPEDDVFHYSSYNDSLDQRYEKARRSVQHFTITQFGICLWEFENNENKWIARPYNFYLFPSTPHRVFSVYSGSVKFLLDNGFDFNKAFKKGITFINEEQLNQYLEDIRKKPNIKIKDEKTRQFVDNNMYVVRFKFFIYKLRKMISDWYNKSDHGDIMYFEESDWRKKNLIQQEVSKM